MGIDHFHASKPHTPPLSLTNTTSSSLASTCDTDASYKLFDDDTETCVKVRGLMKLDVTSSVSLDHLQIHTKGMDCSLTFHVLPFISTGLSHVATGGVYCNHQVHPAPLLSSAEHNDGTECLYAVPQVNGSLVVRLAAVHEAGICSITGVV